MLHQLSPEYGLVSVGISDLTRLVSSKYSWAKTAISCAFPYPHSQMHSPTPVLSGSVASFAMGPDYHHIVTNGLQQLSSRIIEQFPGHYTVNVDDPDISERAIALHSGIGWIGRNQCLYVPIYGSFVVLGEILTDVECAIQPDIQDQLCGNCTLCIDSCPTRALNDDGQFYRERCISHLTQTRGLIPFELLPLLGDHVYGCDICQAVCPHNQLTVQIDNELSVSCYPGPFPSLYDIIQLSSTDWNENIRNSSIGWIGRTTWRRNAIIAAANKNLTDMTLLFSHLSKDESPIVSSTAKCALARMFA